MAHSKGHNNTQSPFGVYQIPSNNHIRDLLNDIKPTLVFPMFTLIFKVLENGKHLSEFRFLKIIC